MGSSRLSWLLLIISFTVFSGMVDVYSQCLENQKTILLQFKQFIIFNASLSSKLVLWNSSMDCCSWAGVTCSSGHVTALDLNRESIIGGVDNSSSLFHLQYLQVIDLSENPSLEGSLPKFLPQNGSLQTMVLSETNFSGKLPDSIGNLKKLSRIDLSSCNFNGTIPSSMVNLTQLVYLSLSFNRFTGPIPSFCSSKNLTKIILSHNELTGQIPSHQWEGILNLVDLDLRYNSLSGSIPLSLFSLPSLQTIRLSNNQFDGPLNEFPSVSSHLLYWLDLSINKLEGPVPMSVFKLQGLKWLSLSYNNFNGTLDYSSMIQNLANLRSLDLSFNNLSIITTGNESASTPLHQPRLITLDLSSNQLRGEIPCWVWNIGSMYHQLNLSDVSKSIINYSTKYVYSDR